MFDNFAWVEAVGAQVDLAHEQTVCRDLDQQPARRRTERSGVDQHPAPGQPPDARTVHVPGDQKTGVRPVSIEQRLGAVGSLTPGPPDAPDAGDGPDGVAQEPGKVFQPVALALVALGDAPGGLAVNLEQLRQAQRFATEGLAEVSHPFSRDRRIVAPRHDVVKEHVAMRHHHRAAGEILRVKTGNVGIVIPGDESHAGGMALNEGLKGRLERSGVIRGRPRTGVDGVAVAEKQVGTVKQRAQLIERMHGAGTIAVVQVGDDADNGLSHAGAREHARRGGQVISSKACGRAPGGNGGRMRIRWWWLLVLTACISPLRADQGDDLARIHVEAIGGYQRLHELTSMRVRGYVNIDARHLTFTFIAQRPNRLWMETRAADHVIVQATDGVNPPWQMDPQARPLKPVLLQGTEAGEFSADAEFDDPLVDSASKGYTVDYAGEVTWDGKPAYRLLITRRFVDSYYLILEEQTYFIVGRQSTRKRQFGPDVKIETRYEDFRPVAGVIMPHRILVSADGRLLHETVLEKIEPNVPVPAGIFTIPAVAAKSEGP